MAVVSIQPAALVAIVAAGGELPGAGAVKTYLAGQGITAEVTMRGDGTILMETEATAAAVQAALAAFDPPTHGMDPDLAAARALVADVRQVETQLAALAVRTPEQTALLRLARLQLALIRAVWRRAEA